jgi:hypothetical protein
MHIQIKRQITINVSADKVWNILAHHFDHIGRWASAIPESRAVTDWPAPEGAEVGGRVCTPSVAGFGDIQEKFTYYDEQAMRFGYQAIGGGLPSFIKRAENNWTVRSLGPNQCVVEARGEIDLRLIPGLFLAPFLKLQMGRTGTQTFEELKYFIEHDQPHPRKLKAQQKQLQKTSVHS